MLKRTELVKTSLDASGYLVTSEPDITPINFSNPTDENVFGMKDGEKIVPGSKYSAKMQIENHSDVAFGYWIEIVCTDKESGQYLAEQLKVTVNTGSDQSDCVGNGLLVRGNDGGYVGELAVGDKEAFTITVEFLDSAVSSNNIEDNNLAKGEKLGFDLVVHAVQLTTAPAS